MNPIDLLLDSIHGGEVLLEQGGSGMRLEIHTAEELAAAREAVKKIRATRIQPLRRRRNEHQED